MFISLISLTANFPILAAEINYKLIEPNISEGISQVELLDITQDNEGYLWFGTEDGLNRYDGYEYKIFRPSKTIPSRLAYPRINELLYTSTNTLLVGTPLGLQKYDPISQSFESILIYDDNENLTSKIAVTEIYEDINKTIWVGTSRGGITIISNDIERKLNFNIKNSNLDSNSIRSITGDNNKVWVATKNGLYYYDFTDNNDTFLLKKIESAYQVNQILSLAISGNFLWVGTQKGLFRINSETYNVVKFEKDSKNTQLNDEFINIVLPLEDYNAIAIGTGSGGLSILNYKTNELVNYLKNNESNIGLKNNNVTALYKDKSNNLWIGTDEGINLIKLNGSKFGHHLSNGINYNCKNNNDIFAATIESKNTLWIASFTSGLHHINLDTGQCVSFDSTEIDQTKIIFNNIVSLLVTQDKYLWIGTLEHGLINYNTETSTFNRIKGIPDDARILGLESVEDKIIASSTERGVFIVNQDGFESKEFLADNLVIPSYSLLHTKDNSFYFAETSKGLIKLDALGNVLITFKDKFPQLPNTIHSMAEDLDGSIWLATKGLGIFKLNPKTNQLTEFNLENSNLPSNMFWLVKTDNNNNVWFSGSKGLSRYNNETKKFDNFNKRDGLQEDPYTIAGGYDTHSDMMLFGGINGFNYFSPSNIKTESQSIKVAITEFELLYEKSELLRQTTIEANNSELDLLLDYDQNVLSFKFSGLDYSDPKLIKYAYMLEGSQQNWIHTDASNRFANFTNLSPGTYTFKVKAANKHNVWSDTETKVNIKIMPPWWATYSAYVTYFILVIISISLFISFRTRVLKRRAIFLETTVAKRTLELKQEKHKVDELLLIKNEEFANISHEFRTPLTLILGPVSQLLKSETTGENINRLNIIQRSGYRLLRMVDQLLNMETFKVKALTKKSSQPIGQIIQLISHAFFDLAIEKDINFSVGEVENISFEFTPDALEKILLNLLSNAIKYTPKGGSVKLQAQRTKDGLFEIIVDDTGIGIEKNKQALVFERFQRAISPENEHVPGAGIGLALVKNLIEIHQGSVRLHSELGKGTCITISLPIIGEVTTNEMTPHLNNEIIAMEMMNLTNFAEKENHQKILVEHLDTERLTILTIEDNQDMSQYISQCLSADYNCLTAKNGKIGVEIALAEIPDIIISDVMMPEMDGFEVTNLLRNNDITSHIPIILLTARGDRDSRIKGWNEKVDEYLTKPFDAEELLIRIQNLIDIRNILRKRFSENLFDIKSNIRKPNESNSLNTSRETQQNNFLVKINNILEEKYQDSDFKMIQVVSEIGMSERQLHRKFKAISDMTPAEYLRDFRLQKACELLLLGKNPSFVSLDVGFSSHSYFSRCFKAKYVCSPSEYH